MRKFLLYRLLFRRLLFFFLLLTETLLVFFVFIFFRHGTSLLKISSTLLFTFSLPMGSQSDYPFRHRMFHPRHPVTPLHLYLFFRIPKSPLLYNLHILKHNNNQFLFSCRVSGIPQRTFCIAMPNTAVIGFVTRAGDAAR